MAGCLRRPPNSHRAVCSLNLVFEEVVNLDEGLFASLPTRPHFQVRNDGEAVLLLLLDLHLNLIGDYIGATHGHHIPPSLLLLSSKVAVYLLNCLKMISS